jgi:hypothetical protein
VAVPTLGPSFVPEPALREREPALLP